MKRNLETSYGYENVFMIRYMQQKLMGIANGTLNLENQNQGKNLEETADLGNRLDLLSDEMQTHKKRHAQHRNEMDSQQSSKPLDTMPDDDLRHPYSAHRPKQKHVEPPRYRKNFEESRSAQKAISNSIERTKEIFYHLKERYITEYDMERNYTQTNLQDAQSLYKDFRHLKDQLLDNESFMQEQREAIHVFLEEDPVSNRPEHLRKYLEMYNTEINNLSLDKLKIDSHIDDCEKIVNELNEAIKNMESRSVNEFTTESPTISPQEKNILTRSKDLSTQFNKLTQEINHLRGQVEELESDMFWENQFPGHESPNRMKDIKAKLTHIRNDQLPKLEGERTFVQSEIMKEKHYIESLVREEKMSPSKAIEYRKEYEKLIHRFEESISQVDNERNKREKVGKPNFSENTLTTATTERPMPVINTTTTERPTPAINTATIEKPITAIGTVTTEDFTPTKTTTTERPILSTPEAYIRRRNKILELKFDMVKQETKAVGEQLTKIEDVLLLKKNHDFTFSKINDDLREQRDDIKNKLLPKLKNETILVQEQIMNEKNYINSLLKIGEISPLKATEYTNDYDKLIHQFEKTSNQFDIDSRRMKELFPNFTPATATNNTFTTESTPETYIRKRNKMLESDFSKVMKEIKYLHDTVNWATSYLKFNIRARKKTPDGYPEYTPTYSDEYLNAELDEVRNNQLPKVEYKRDLLQSQIMNEKHYISSLIKEGKINFLKAAEYMNEYEKLIQKFENPISDINLDNARVRIDSLVKQSLSKYTSTIEKNNKTIIVRSSISTPETYIRKRNKLLEKSFYIAKEKPKDLYERIAGIKFDLYIKETNPESDINVEDSRAQLEEMRNNQLPKFDYARGLVQEQIMNEKNYINSLVKAGKMSDLEAKEYTNKYNELITINRFEPPIPDINLDNAKERIDSLFRQSYLTKYAPTTERPTPAIDISTTARPTVSPQELDIQKRIMERVLRYDVMEMEKVNLVNGVKFTENLILAKKKNPDDNRIPSIEDSREELKAMNARLLSLENERKGIQSDLMNEKNAIKPLVKKGKMSAEKAEEYINMYNELIDKFKEPIPDINMIHTTTTKRAMITTTTPESPIIFISESEVRKKIEEREGWYNVWIEEIKTLRDRANYVEEMLLAKKKNPEYNLPSIENLRGKREFIRNLLLRLENERPDIQSALTNEKNAIETLVKERKMSDVKAAEYINRYNKLIDKYKQPIPDINMDNIKTTTEITATTTTEIPTLSNPETYIRRRNKILELKFDMIMQEITYLSKKANDIEDMLFFKEQFPNLRLPNSIDVLREQRYEIREDLLPGLEYERDLVQFQIMNEKDAIESLVKAGKMSDVEAEKYRNEYNKLMDKFELPMYDINIESDNKRKKRDLSIKQNFSEKLASTATDNKEKPRLAEKLASIATNNKEKLEKLSIMKREPAISR